VKLLSVDEAKARMLARITPLPPEAVALADAAGRVLAEDIAAVRDQPPFRASAMDGWAIRAAEAPGRLRVVGESAAGHGYDALLGPGEAVRIFTGAAVPEGADTVVIQEDAIRDGEGVEVPDARPGANIRAAGGDFRSGDALLTRGQRLDAWRISLAASAGRAQVLVHGQPRVVFLGTGEEIIEAPTAPGPWQIYDSGSVALRAMAQAWGARAARARSVRDDLDATVAAIRAAEADLVVTVGGASVGDYDLVRAAGAALGLELDVSSVNVRPGKPTFFGVLGDGRRLLGLPGNPASAFVCAELFLRPIIAAYTGAATAYPVIAARTTQALGPNGPREHWMRARLETRDGGLWVAPYRDQDSSLVTVFAAANALLRRPGGAPAAAEGELVEATPLARA
jgi:molybdopterin molybdotransferase